MSIGVAGGGQAGNIGIRIVNGPVPQPTRVDLVPDFAGRLGQAAADQFASLTAGPVGYLRTDGGAHSAAAWATITCAQLIDVDAGSGNNFAREWRHEVAEILVAAFDGVIRSERAQLAEDANRLLVPVVCRERAAPIYAVIAAAGVETPWARHYRDEKVTKAAVDVIAKDIASAILIERQIFASAHPESAAAQEFLAISQVG